MEKNTERNTKITYLILGFLIGSVLDIGICFFFIKERCSANIINDPVSEKDNNINDPVSKKDEVFKYHIKSSNPDNDYEVSVSGNTIKVINNKVSKEGTLETKAQKVVFIYNADGPDVNDLEIFILGENKNIYKAKYSTDTSSFTINKINEGTYVNINTKQIEEASHLIDICYATTENGEEVEFN